MKAINCWAVGLCALSTLLLGSCGQKLTEDLSKISDFHSLNFSKKTCSIEPAVDLYIDYSTCLVEALNSSYYQAVHPAIVDCSPTFWSIKGKEIKEETKDAQMVYQLLRTIKEVNNAEIKNAVTQIVHANRQAVLITDGEYYMQGATGDNLNNPYLADMFRTWLNKGNDVYIYSEPYLEAGKFNKFRYYMLFTNQNLENNIQQRFERSAPKVENVKMFHLSNSVPAVTFAEGYPLVNECLSLNSGTFVRGAGFECQEYQTSWKDLYKYILADACDAMGNPLKGGDFVLKGLFLKNDENGCYKTVEIEPVVYHAYLPYQAMIDSLNSNATPQPAGKLEKAEKIFVIDQAAFEKDGEIILRLDPDFDGSSLKADVPNLLKVDFVLKKSAENFSQNEAVNRNFQWVSISSRNDGKNNTSLFQSINQLLLDPTLNPSSREDAIIYTIYISTLSN